MLAADIGLGIGPQTGVLVEQFNGIGGSNLSALTSHATYPNTPDIVATTGDFASARNVGNNFGLRMRGYITAPVDGDYTFWIAADDNGELWFSDDSSASNAVKIAEATQWTGHRQWTKYGSQQSVSISLVAGETYYIEALMKERWGGDNLSVAWSGPGVSGGTPVVIAGEFLTALDPANDLAPVTDLDVEFLSHSEALIGWAIPDGSSVVGYEVQASNDGGASFETVATTEAGATLALALGLEEESDYLFRVVATDSDPNANPVSAFVSDSTPAKLANGESGFYQISLGSNGNWTRAEAGYGAEGTFEAGSDYVYADDIESAIRQAVTGSVLVTDFNGNQNEFEFGADRAFEVIQFGDLSAADQLAAKDKFSQFFGLIPFSVSGDQWLIVLEDSYGWKSNGDFDHNDGYVLVQAEDVPVVNLRVDSNHDSNIDEKDDNEEKLEPGRIVGVNYDDDNKDGVPDLENNPVGGAVNSVAGENDLVKATLSLEGFAAGTTITFNFIQGQSKVKFWTTSDKAKELKTTYIIGTDEVPSTFYIEGASTGKVLLEVVARTGEGVQIASDKVMLSVVKVQLNELFFGDNFEITNPGNVGDYFSQDFIDKNGDGDGEDAGERAYPVGYVRNTKVKITAAIFSLLNGASGGGEGKTATVRAKARGINSDVVASASGNLDSYLFEDAEVDIADINWIVVRNVLAKANLPNTVLFYDDFIIDWEFSFDKSVTWVAAGSSNNPFYATLGSPDLSGRTVTTHTALDIGSRNAHGMTDPTAIVAAIWSEFADLHVTQVNETAALTYYKTTQANGCTATSTTTLLKNGDGQCGAWAQFLKDAINIQGIAGAAVKEVNAMGSDGFVINNWVFKATGSQPEPYSFLLDKTNIPGSDLIDNKTVKGQGGGVPVSPLESIFSKHFVVEFGGKYYDPAYGKVFNSQLDWESGSLAGFYQSIGNGRYLVKKDNSTVVETIFKPTNR